MKKVLQSFVSVTQADEYVAKRFLEGTQGNLEMALEQFFECPNKYPGQEEDTKDQDEPESCRPPMLPVRTRLLDHSDSASPIPVSSRHAKRGSAHDIDKSRTIFEAFRDLRSERESLDSGNARKGKASNLAELFRPPLEYLFTGTFEEAKEYAAKQCRYLIINVQDQTLFDSQLLNRDTWSNSEVQALLKTSFVLMQIYEGTSRASEYTRWYHVSKLPHIGILDGRTGERVLSLGGFTPALELLGELQNALLTYPSNTGHKKPFLEKNPGQEKKLRPIEDLTEEEQISVIEASFVNNSDDIKGISSLDGGSVFLDDSVVPEDCEGKTDEESPLTENRNNSIFLGGPDRPNKRGVQGEWSSLDCVHSTSSKRSKQEGDRIDQDVRSDNPLSTLSLIPNEETELVEPQEGVGKPEVEEDLTTLDCTLQIRLPDGVLLIQKFRSTAKLSAVHAFVSRKMRNAPFSLLTNFPRKIFSEQELHTMTLADAELVPRAVLIAKEL